MADLVNDYRAQNGLPPVRLSKALTAVAQWHTLDTEHAHDVSGVWGSDSSCSIHSWYGVPGSSYRKCCYTADHAKAACMWNKPKELSGGAYTGAGFENAAVGYSSVKAAVEGWKSSSGHNRVILNKGTWADTHWKAMGVGVDPVLRSYYLWFGQDADPAGAPRSCPAVQCPAQPARSCVDSFREATLVIDERETGRESLVAKWLGGPRLRGTDFGNPRRSDGTEYATCVYDDQGELVGEHIVAAAGEKCGDTACWKNIGGARGDPGHQGYRFLDKASRQDGIRFMRLKGGGPGTSKAIVRGVNNAKLGRRALPTGTIRALRASRGATIQLHRSDSRQCLSARLDDVVVDGWKIFKAQRRK